MDHDSHPPIIVMSFNRPEYLARVLDSLKAQQPRLDERRIHLFQDGAVNAYSGIERAGVQHISESVALFCRAFPNGHVHFSQPNIGICENFLRAERFVFEELNAPFAYFFEDDLVLHPAYVATLDVLRRSFEAEPRIGYFNAFGEFWSALDIQEKNRNRIIPMGQLWGFALRQSHWRNAQPLLASYYELVCGKDYRKRPHEDIRKLFRQWGIYRPQSSQDSAKKIATYVLDCCCVSSFFTLGKYIGEIGTHSTSEDFASRGFATAPVYDGEIPASFIFTLVEIDAQVEAVKNEWNGQQV